MAYENGRRVNHYAKKIKHKENQQRKKVIWWNCVGMSYQQFFAIQAEDYIRDLEHHGEKRCGNPASYKKYWTPKSETSWKSFTKELTNSKTRAQERKLNCLTDETCENLFLTLNRSDYKHIY